MRTPSSRDGLIRGAGLFDDFRIWGGRRLSIGVAGRHTILIERPRTEKLNAIGKQVHFGAGVLNALGVLPPPRTEPALHENGLPLFQVRIAKLGGLSPRNNEMPLDVLTLPIILDP